ncbi:MAPEG family protein [Pseudooceanicola sediminis]|uniref:MAPEG family protein n=1 Tax=Pseudooceanicola sediminis TaxID=2211117 RepID=A0A399J9T3_9RHOB|nr:MAPEG family protein [Pseudooceanicola sediminis]KAA2314628.1 MAPEG family protein [Puniceibacterium sp. HSS470]RII39416.1 MAPEG family protein [Pseudooceanicola sediminis]|tara:strand:+ start:1251 stop:1661 length:411 start_codon:yes stop_codon:yes gene_type:complete
MPNELQILALAGLLQVLQIILMAVPANLELGRGKTTSPRDPGRMEKPLMDQVSPVTGRLYRAMNNHFEGLILFTIAVLTVSLLDASTPLTRACAALYLAARILYIPAYAFGWVPWRSLIWLAGLTATTLMLITALL